MEHGLDLYEQYREPQRKLASSTEVITRPTELQAEFECPICLELMHQTTITMCMHRFCRECILKAIRKSKSEKLCPICKTKIETVRSLRADTKFDEMIELLFPKDFEDDQMEEAAQFIKAATITQKEKEIHVVLRKLVTLPGGGATGVDPHGPSRTIKVAPIQCTIGHVIKYLQFTDELFGSSAPEGDDAMEEDEAILIFSKVEKSFSLLDESETLEELAKDRGLQNGRPLELYFQIV